VGICPEQVSGFFNNLGADPGSKDTDQTSKKKQGSSGAGYKLKLTDRIKNRD
jgi:hypothetical protein